MNSVESKMGAALGYVQLGMFEDANDEIESLPVEAKTTKEVFRLRAWIFMSLSAWELLKEVSAILVDSDPKDAQHWIWLAYATRRVESIADAEAVLLNALEYHPKDATIRFNLACYCSQQGQLDNAKQWLKEAIGLDPECRKMALDDPDLEPLWDQIGA